MPSPLHHSIIRGWAMRITLAMAKCSNAAHMEALRDSLRVLEDITRNELDAYDTAVAGASIACARASGLVAYLQEHAEKVATRSTHQSGHLQAGVTGIRDTLVKDTLHLKVLKKVLERCRGESPEFTCAAFESALRALGEDPLRP